MRRTTSRSLVYWHDFKSRQCVRKHIFHQFVIVNQPNYTMDGLAETTSNIHLNQVEYPKILAYPTSWIHDNNNKKKHLDLACVVWFSQTHTTCECVRLTNLNFDRLHQSECVSNQKKKNILKNVCRVRFKRDTIHFFLFDQIHLQISRFSIGWVNQQQQKNIQTYSKHKVINRYTFDKLTQHR